MVDRKQISETMRRRRVRERLVRRCEEVLRETMSRMKGQAGRELLDSERSETRMPAESESVHAPTCGRGGNAGERGLERS